MQELNTIPVDPDATNASVDAQITEAPIADPTPDGTGMLVSAELLYKRYSIRTGIPETDDEEHERETREHMFEEVDVVDEVVTATAPDRNPLRPRNIRRVFLMMSTELADAFYDNTDIKFLDSELVSEALAEADKDLKAVAPDAELAGFKLNEIEVAQVDEDIWSLPSDCIKCLFIDEEGKLA